MKEKIAFVEYDMSKNGGVLNVLKHLSQELTSVYEVHMISLNNPIGEMDKNESVSAYVNMTENQGRVRSVYQHSIRKLAKYLKKNEIKVAILTGHFTAPLSLFLKFNGKTKFIFADHGALINQLDQKMPTLYRRIGSKCAEYTVTLTEQTALDYQEIFKRDKSKLLTIYNSIPDVAIKNHSYQSTSNKVVSATRFTSEKGLDLLIDVAQWIIEKQPNVSWVWEVYGDGPEFEKVSQLIVERNLKNFLHLKGFRHSMTEVYAESALLVLTSYREGLPLVLLEGKASQLPLVSFNVQTGPKEIITDGVNGYLVNCYDTEKMAALIINLMEDKEKRILFSEKSLTDIDKFSESKIINQWLALIDKTMNG